MSPSKIGAIWLDNHRLFQPITRNGSKLSKQFSSDFSALIQGNTSSSTIVHVPTLLDNGANSSFMDPNFALTHKITLEKL